MRSLSPLPKYKLKQLNVLLTNGYFQPIKTCCDYVWGISAFKTRDNEIIVEKLEGRFLGGGIVESYGYKVKLGTNTFWAYNFHYVLRCVYTYLTKKGILQ